jgi:hypothetical protein
MRIFRQEQKSRQEKTPFSMPEPEIPRSTFSTQNWHLTGAEGAAKPLQLWSATRGIPVKTIPVRLPWDMISKSASVDGLIQTAVDSLQSAQQIAPTILSTSSVL